MSHHLEPTLSGNEHKEKPLNILFYSIFYQRIAKKNHYVVVKLREVCLRLTHSHLFNSVKNAHTILTAAYILAYAIFNV